MAVRMRARKIVAIITLTLIKPTALLSASVVAHEVIVTHLHDVALT